MFQILCIFFFNSWSKLAWICLLFRFIDRVHTYVCMWAVVLLNYPKLEEDISSSVLRFFIARRAALCFRVALFDIAPSSQFASSCVTRARSVFRRVLFVVSVRQLDAIWRRITFCFAFAVQAGRVFHCHRSGRGPTASPGSAPTPTHPQQRLGIFGLCCGSTAMLRRVNLVHIYLVRTWVSLHRVHVSVGSRK